MNLIGRLLEAGDSLIATEERLNRYQTSDYYDGFRNCIMLDDAFVPAPDQ